MTLFFLQGIIEQDSIGAKKKGQVTDMPLMDEFKEQREAMKTKPFKERFDYFWYYHKGHVIGGFCALVVGIILIYDAVTSKDTAFYAAFLNAFSTEQEQEFIDDFAVQAGIDLDKYQVILDTGLRFNLSQYDEASKTSIERFLAMTTAGEIDVAVAERDLFANYAENDMFLDLRNFLTKEQLERCRESLFYYDAAAVEEELDMDALMQSDTFISKDEVERRDPSSMKEPVPVGVFLDDTMKRKLTDSGYYAQSQELVFGVLGKGEDTAYASRFFDWLTCEEE